MTTQHTPAPWILSAGRNINTPHGDFFLSYSHDKHGSPSFKPKHGWSEMDQNARLIAAAPEMLEALKIAMHYMEGDSDDEQEQEDYALIMKAIAKAIGEDVA